MAESNTPLGSQPVTGEVEYPVGGSTELGATSTDLNQTLKGQRMTAQILLTTKSIAGTDTPPEVWELNAGFLQLFVALAGLVTEYSYFRIIDLTLEASNIASITDSNSVAAFNYFSLPSSTAKVPDTQDDYAAFVAKSPNTLYIYRGGSTKFKIHPRSVIRGTNFFATAIKSTDFWGSAGQLSVGIFAKAAVPKMTIPVHCAVTVEFLEPRPTVAARVTVRDIYAEIQNYSFVSGVAGKALKLDLDNPIPLIAGTARVTDLPSFVIYETTIGGVTVTGKIALQPATYAFYPRELPDGTYKMSIIVPFIPPRSVTNMNAALLENNQVVCDITYASQVDLDTKWANTKLPAQTTDAFQNSIYNLELPNDINSLTLKMSLPKKK